MSRRIPKHDVTAHDPLPMLNLFSYREGAIPEVEGVAIGATGSKTHRKLIAGKGLTRAPSTELCELDRLFPLAITNATSADMPAPLGVIHEVGVTHEALHHQRRHLALTIVEFAESVGGFWK